MRPTQALENKGIVKAGMLREFCNIQRIPEKQTNSNGFKNNNWETFLRVKCSMAQQTLFAQTVGIYGASINDIYFTIRYRDDIKTSDRIEYRNKFYKIFSLADKNGNKEFLEIRCQEICD